MEGRELRASWHSPESGRECIWGGFLEELMSQESPKGYMLLIFGKSRKCSRETEQTVCTKCQRQESMMPSENCTSSFSMIATENTKGTEFWEMRPRTRAHILSCWYKHCGLCWVLFLGFYLLGWFFVFYQIYHFKTLSVALMWFATHLISEHESVHFSSCYLFLGKYLYGTQLPTYISCFSFLSLLFYP